MATATTGTGRGRQAEARRNDLAVLDAARLVFAVHGPDAPVSAVASEAGVGMGSLYRRFATKVELLQHLCQASLDEQATAAEAALAGDDDAWKALAGFIATCVSFRAGALAPLAGTLPVTTEMMDAAQRAHLGLERLVARAQEAGTLRRDVTSVDIHQLIQLFSRRPPDEELVHDRLLVLSLGGLQVHDDNLPGPPLSWREYAARWRST